MYDGFAYARRSRTSGAQGWWPHVAALLALLGLTALVNSGVEILGLYQDDLYAWDVYSSHRPVEFVFLTGTSRFRPVWNLVSCILFKAAGPHTQWLVPIHLLVNGMIAWLVYHISLRLSGSLFVGFLMGAAYALSHFAYYQVSMVLGMMEAFALAFSILLLYFLIRYLDGGRSEGLYGYGAVGCYLMTVFTHERYMVLILLMVAVFGARRDWRRFFLSLAAFGMVQLIRLWAIGTISPPGTGDTTVAETFRLTKALGFAVSQVLYLFGINAGPEHLNGIPWSATAPWVKLLVGASIAVLALLCLLAVFAMARLGRAAAIGRLAVFAGFIALCIGCSSVTVRVEMRWVYVSYTAALCTLAHLYGLTAEGFGRQGKGMACAVGLAVAYVALLVPIEGYYRNGWSRMYYHDGQKQMNSLAEETWFRYGEDLFEKKVYVLGNTFEIADYTWETVFRIFHPEKLRGVPQVQVIEDVDQLGLIDGSMIILAEDRKDRSYIDVTDYVREEKLKPVSGYYEDGWADEACRFRVRTGSTGKLRMSGYYPGRLRGDETTRLSVQGVTVPMEQEQEIAWNRDTMAWTLDLEPYQTYEVSMESDFYVEDAKERRGRGHLAFLLDLKAD